MDFIKAIRSGFLSSSNKTNQTNKLSGLPIKHVYDLIETWHKHVDGPWLTSGKGSPLRSPLLGDRCTLPGQEILNFPNLKTTEFKSRLAIMIFHRKCDEPDAPLNARQVVEIGLGPVGHDISDWLKQWPHYETLIRSGVDKINICYCPEIVMLHYLGLLITYYEPEIS